MAEKLLEPLELYYPYPVSLLAASLFENFNQSTILAMRKDLEKLSIRPQTIESRIQDHEKKIETGKKRGEKKRITTNPDKMEIPDLLTFLKTLTGKIDGDETISAYKIVYDENIYKLSDNGLDGKLKHDIMVLSKSHQLVCWNAYCIGHELQVAKHRAFARKKKWADYLNLTVGTTVYSVSYALCQMYVAFKYVSGQMSWVINRVDLIRGHLSSDKDEANWWMKEPGGLVITSLNE